MSHPSRLFRIAQPLLRPPSWGDAVVFMSLAALIYLGVHLGLSAPPAIKGPEISLSPEHLLYYAGLSTGRMAAAYLLSVIFSLIYGTFAANHRGAEKVSSPLDAATMPILSFLPVVL
jgi:NitT/TauT family transport system permease protein